MTTIELINYLRSFAHYANSVTETDRSKLYQAADRLEELDERVAIMTEPVTDPDSDPDGASPNPAPTAGR